MLVYVGYTAQLHAVAWDAEGIQLSNVTAQWASSDTAVAFVDSTGLVSGVREGDAQITARVQALQGSAAVAVRLIPVDTIVIVTERDTMWIRDEQMVRAVLLTAGRDTLTDRTVSWQVYDTRVVTMDDTGAVYARGVGTTELAARVPYRVTYKGLRVVSDYSATAMGEISACGIGTGGALMCWGSGEATGCCVIRETPFLVSRELSFADVKVGRAHGCALDPGGHAYCWGFNELGQLGTGTRETSLSPLPVQGELTFAALSASDDYTCGLTGDGTAYCWGGNIYGRLGIGQNGGSFPTPQVVLGGLQFSAIDAGWKHTCAIASDSTAYCWGSGYLGRDSSDWGQSTYEPARVMSEVPLIAISVGAVHTCAVGADGAGYCWGLSEYGRLGLGNLASSLVPARVVGDHVFRSIHAGRAHSCALTTTGRVFCWGVDGGVLGTGTTSREYSTTPVRVTTEYPVVWLTVGNDASCLIDTEATLYCWGAYRDGKLGNGEYLDRASPTRVFGQP